jgi:hypothetical protein
MVLLVVGAAAAAATVVGAGSSCSHKHFDFEVTLDNLAFYLVKLYSAVRNQLILT